MEGHHERHRSDGQKVGVKEDEVISHHGVSDPKGSRGELVEDGRVGATVILLQAVVKGERGRLGRGDK